MNLKEYHISWIVIPVKAGIQENQVVMDSCFRRNDRALDYADNKTADQIFFV